MKGSLTHIYAQTTARGELYYDGYSGLGQEKERFCKVIPLLLWPRGRMRQDNDNTQITRRKKKTPIYTLIAYIPLIYCYKGENETRRP